MPHPPPASRGVPSIPFRVEPVTRSGPPGTPGAGEAGGGCSLTGPHPSQPLPTAGQDGEPPLAPSNSSPASPALHPHLVSGPAGPRWATRPSTVSWAGPRFPLASRAQACPVLEPRAHPLPPTPSLPCPLDKQDVGGTGSPSPRAGRGAGTAGPALPLLMGGDIRLESPPAPARPSPRPTARTRAPPGRLGIPPDQLSPSWREGDWAKKRQEGGPASLLSLKWPCRVEN